MLFSVMSLSLGTVISVSRTRLDDGRGMERVGGEARSRTLGRKDNYTAIYTDAVRREVSAKT